MKMHDHFMYVSTIFMFLLQTVQSQDESKLDLFYSFNEIFDSFLQVPKIVIEINKKILGIGDNNN